MSFLPKHLGCRGFNGSRTPCCAWTTIYMVLVVSVSAHSILKTSKSFQNSPKLVDSGMPVEGLKELDEVIQVNAFASFGKSRTGETYEVVLPSNLTGVQAFAIRLRIGSLRRRGLTLKEFSIPQGAVVNLMSVRVLLVYREVIGINVFARMGYMLVSPVLGIRVYDAFNLSSRMPVSEVDLVATESPITVRIPFLSSAPVSIPLCATFDRNGGVTVKNVSSSPNVCSTLHSGDFGLVIPASALAPASVPAAEPELSPLSAPSPFLPQPPSESPTSANGRTKHKNSNAWKIALGSVFGAIGFLGILGLLAFTGLRYRENGKIARMEHEADRGETLHTTVIGENRASIAGSSRTRPGLESDYTQ